VSSWYATGRLEALWDRVGGRDGLERVTGIGGTTLSGYNTGGRKLGRRNGEKIADALGVSVVELGAPEDLADQPGLSVFARLEALENTVGRQHRANAKALAGIAKRLEQLEQQLAPRTGRATRPQSSS
jgi:hypothetical protein